MADSVSPSSDDQVQGPFRERWVVELREEVVYVTEVWATSRQDAELFAQDRRMAQTIHPYSVEQTSVWARPLSGEEVALDDGDEVPLPDYPSDELQSLRPIVTVHLPPGDVAPF